MFGPFLVVIIDMLNIWPWRLRVLKRAFSAAITKTSLVHWDGALSPIPTSSNCHCLQDQATIGPYNQPHERLMVVTEGWKWALNVE